MLLGIMGMNDSIVSSLSKFQEAEKLPVATLVTKADENTSLEPVDPASLTVSACYSAAV